MFDEPRIVPGKEHTARVIRNVSYVVLVLSILIYYFISKDNDIGLILVGIVMYNISNYLLTTFFQCRVPERNGFTFRLRCVFSVITLVSLIYTIVIVLFADGYAIWILSSVLIFAFSLVVLYNGYQAERNANDQED